MSFQKIPLIREIAGKLLWEPLVTFHPWSTTCWRVSKVSKTLTGVINRDFHVAWMSVMY